MFANYAIPATAHAIRLIFYLKPFSSSASTKSSFIVNMCQGFFQFTLSANRVLELRANFSFIAKFPYPQKQWCLSSSTSLAKAFTDFTVGLGV